MKCCNIGVRIWCSLRCNVSILVLLKLFGEICNNVIKVLVSKMDALQPRCDRQLGNLNDAVEEIIILMYIYMCTGVRYKLVDNIRNKLFSKKRTVCGH